MSTKQPAVAVVFKFELKKSHFVFASAVGEKLYIGRSMH